MDLTVAVKNVSGLEDALWNMYVEEEVFDCDNLYHCGTCDRLVKAAKVTMPSFPFCLETGRFASSSHLCEVRKIHLAALNTTD